jgi:hypothetical protein
MTITPVLDWLFDFTVSDIAECNAAPPHFRLIQPDTVCLPILIALPSPSILLQQHNRRTYGHLRPTSLRKAQLLQTIPLLSGIGDLEDEGAIFNFQRTVSPAVTPVEVLISKDWKLGVALLRPSNVSRGPHVTFRRPCTS